MTDPRLPERYATDRLTVQTWHTRLDTPTKRTRLERTLNDILLPAVLRHLPPPLQDAADIAAWVDAREAESTGYTITTTGDETIIGLLILAGPFDAPVPACHIGYLFALSAWGQGFASEMLQGLISALEGKGPLELIAGVEASNPASARVLVKAGFEEQPQADSRDSTMYRYRLR